MSIKGKLILVGGAINTGKSIPTNITKEETTTDFFFQNGILKKIIDESKLGKESRIEIVTTASQSPKLAADAYIKAFELLGALNVAHLDINTRQDAVHPDSLKRLVEANVVFL